MPSSSGCSVGSTKARSCAWSQTPMGSMCSAAALRSTTMSIRSIRCFPRSQAPILPSAAGLSPCPIPRICLTRRRACSRRSICCNTIAMPATSRWCTSAAARISSCRRVSGSSACRRRFRRRGTTTYIRTPLERPATSLSSWSIPTWTPPTLRESATRPLRLRATGTGACCMTARRCRRPRIPPRISAKASAAVSRA